MSCIKILIVILIVYDNKLAFKLLTELLVIVARVACMAYAVL